jgi:hypothetical protein
MEAMDMFVSTKQPAVPDSESFASERQRPRLLMERARLKRGQY